MSNDRNQTSASGPRKFSYRTVILGVAFIVTLVAAVGIDVTGVLEYLKVVGGPAQDTLEIGAIFTVASIAPFLAAGFSVTADYEQRGR